VLDIRIDNVRALLPDAEAAGLSVGIEDGFLRPDCNGSKARRVIDARGLLLAPGIVDIHGDAFERQIMPRPGVSFPIDIALAETDRQLVANGITTAFHGVTYTWEPGLRGRENCLAMIEALERLHEVLACDARFHLRWETFHLEGVDDVAAWLGEGRVDLLAFNNHAPDIFATLRGDGAAKYAQRTGLTLEALLELSESVMVQEAEVAPATERLAGTARDAGVAMLSHDDPDVATRTYYRSLGCTIAEFPKTRDTAAAAREAGEAVVFGAPNVVRGGSHTKAVRAADMVEAGLCDVLATDYYYPAPLHAAFRLADDGLLPLHEAWHLISRNPARAAGLDDRGEIADGRRADLVLIDTAGTLPRPVATVTGGRWHGAALAGS